MSRLERDMEKMGMTKPRPTVSGGEKPALSRRTLSESNAARESERLRLAEQATKDMAPFIAPVPAPVRKTAVWMTLGSIAAFALLVASVPWQRIAYTQEQLRIESESSHDMVCTDGSSNGRDESTFWRWLTGGSSFHCKDWETQEARKERAEQAKEKAYQDKLRAERESRGY